MDSTGHVTLSCTQSVDTAQSNSFPYYLPTASTELSVSNREYWPGSTFAYRKDFELVKLRFNVLIKEALRLFISHSKVQLGD